MELNFAILYEHNYVKGKTEKEKMRKQRRFYPKNIFYMHNNSLGQSKAIFVRSQVNFHPCFVSNLVTYPKGALDDLVNFETFGRAMQLLFR